MTIITTSQMLHDGERNVIMQFTGRSDGSGQESGVVKVDVSELTPPCRAVKISKAIYDVNGGTVTLQWSDPPDSPPFLTLGSAGEFDYSKNGGLVNPTEGGGDILFSTFGFELDASYSVTLEMIKKF